MNAKTDVDRMIGKRVRQWVAWAAFGASYAALYLWIGLAGGPNILPAPRWSYVLGVPLGLVGSFLALRTAWRLYRTPGHIRYLYAMREAFGGQRLPAHDESGQSCPACERLHRHAPGCSCGHCPVGPIAHRDLLF
jgi:hypothetical protein